MTDARKKAALEQEKLRKRAVRLHKQGLTNRVIAQKLGVHAGTVCRWLKLYEREGAGAIKARARGPGRKLKRQLTVNEERKVLQRLIDHTPDQLELTGFLWTRPGVQKLISVTTGANVPIRTVGEYVRRWELIPTAPPSRTRTSSSACVADWLHRTYPSIAQRSAEEGAEIQWLDVSCPITAEKWVFSDKRGKPYEELKSRLVGVHLLSATNNKGKVVFKLAADFNAGVLIGFLARLIASTPRKILVLVDNASEVAALDIGDWLAGQGRRIEVVRYG